MASDTSLGVNEPDSTTRLLAKCVGVGAVLGIVGLVVFIGVTFWTGVLWAPVGLIPAAAAGIGVRTVAGRTGGTLTGLVAVVTGQGPVVLLYLVVVSVLGAYSFGRADAAVAMFGFLVAYKVGSGPDGESVDEGTPSGTAAAAGEVVDPADVNSEAVAEALEGDDVALDDLAEALEEEEKEESADGTSTASGSATADEETASDWVSDDGADGGSDDGATAADDEVAGDLEEPRS